MPLYIDYNEGQGLSTVQEQDKAGNDGDKSSTTSSRGYLTKFGDYMIGSVIGKGTSCTIRKVLQPKTRTLAAIKTLNLLNHPHLFHQELYALQHLHHPYIIKIFDHIFHSDNHASLLLEYIPYPTLLDHLQTFGRISEAMGFVILEQMMDAFVYIHAKGFAHNDIKPENVCYDQTSNKIKIFDFGLSRSTTTPTTSTDCNPSRPTGSPLYMAPEALLQIPHSPQLADIWSIGVTFYEILAGDVPWPHCMDLPTLIDTLKNEEESISFPPDLSISPSAESTVLKMLNRDPTLRVSAEEMAIHLSLRKERMAI